LTDLGQADKVEILKNGTTIIGGKGDWELVERRIEALRVELEQTDNLKECETIQERMTRLASGVSVIRVGAATQIEMIEKKHRIEDAVEAVKAAMDEGIVPGGGTPLLRARLGLQPDDLTPDQALGYTAVLRACEAPIRQMAKNAGESPDIILREVVDGIQSPGWGWDFHRAKADNLIDLGVVDPAKVTRCALQNAGSAAGTLITTGHAIMEVK